MRVLMLSWEYPPHIVGGMGKHVADLVPALADASVEIHVLTPLLRGGAIEEITCTGARIFRTEPPRMEQYGYAAFVQQTNNVMERAARALQPTHGPFDLIHVHDWLSAPAGIALKHAWRRPLLATIHATERGRHQGYIGDAQAEEINSIEWWLTYEAWRIITCSHFMADQVATYFKTPADKIDIIPNGIYVHPSPFKSTAERHAFRKRFAADDQPIVFYVGRIVYEKGLHVLLNAWAHILAHIPQARLLIAGTGSYQETLKTQAWQLGLGASVAFTGFISDEDRDRLYHIADAAVFPSLYEPFGIVALEAMAAHCPVIVSDTGGLREVVQPHETGLVVAPNDPNALAWGVLHTLQHPDWSSTRADNALHTIHERYSWQHIAAETAATYTRIAADWHDNSWGNELARQAP